MQENEFEKQVRQKMDELKLNPSGAVWQKIEVQIKKEKRRRWRLVLLPVLLIGLLYGSYMLLSSDDSNQQRQQQATKNTIEKNNSAKVSTADPDTVKNYYPVKEDKAINAQAATIKSHSNQQIKPQPKLKISSDHTVIENVEKDPSPAFKNEADTTGNIVQREKTGIDIQIPQQEKITANQDKPDSTTAQIAKSADKAITEIAKFETGKDEIKTGTPAKKIKSANKYSWNWGVALAGGVSSMANSFLGYGEQKADATAYTNNSPGTVSGNYPVGPSLIKPSIAFIAGVSAEKNLTKKIMFTSGLTYKLYSTTNTVGTDSSAYFRLTNANNTYHNYYHYLELPVGIKFQLVNLKKTRLYWTTGISLAQLISSNALQFNQFTRLYYRDNSMFNKTQLNFNTGLDVAFISKEKQSFLIGPYFNYGISKIAGEGYNKHHFTFIGLKAQYFFRKK